ncbi:MAG TPA: hypothetical protein VGR16_09995 [Thermomicrobiales bacterium]|nr:hypothetical protein [Thermomicrobiales bacterium]
MKIMDPHRINERSSAGGEGFARGVAIAGGIFFVALGVWAMIEPRSFFDTVATFEPYNRHFLQDIGAFQVGLGAVLLLAVVPASLSGLTVALIGVGVGAALHTVSHIAGHDLGGTPETDIPFFALVAVLLLAAGGYRWRRESGSAR